MESQSYGYTAQTNRGGIDYTYRPLVDIEVGSGDEALTFKALIDSGSDVTVIDKSIAELLGISNENRETGKLSGLGEWHSGFIAPISFKVIGFPKKVLTFNVLFVTNLSENFEIILGQQDFFLNFNVTFKKSKNIFYLEFDS